MQAIVRDGKVVHINGAGHGWMWCDDEAVEIPDQDVSHLIEAIDDEGGVRWKGTLSDLRQYTKEEKDAIERPKKARADLKALGPATGAKSVKELADRVALIEEMLGV